MLFSDETLAELAERYPRLTPAEVRETAARVSRKHDTEPLHNPLAYLNSALHKISERTPRLRPHSETSANAPACRGSLAPDGSWDFSLPVASETERTLRSLAATIARALLSPAQAVDAIKASPVAMEAFRPSIIGVMLRLDAKPQPCPGGPHTQADWVVAAWYCMHTSTSGEEVFKRSVLRALHPTA